MRAVAGIFLVLLGASASARAESLSIRFDAIGSTLDVGSVSARRCGARGRMCPTVVRRRVAIRVDRAAGPAKLVRLRAFLMADEPSVQVRIDGVRLSTQPQLVDGAAITGVSAAHTIEIEVPPSAPPGMLQSSISWIAEDD